jgi:hypothetical protein
MNGSIMHQGLMKNVCFLDHRKHAKMQWLQDPNQSTFDNLNNVRYEASRYFRNKKKKYLKPECDAFETKNKTKNIGELYRGVSDQEGLPF